MTIKVIDKKGICYTSNDGFQKIEFGEVITEAFLKKGFFTEQSLLNLSDKKRISGFVASAKLLSALKAEKEMTEKAVKSAEDKKAVKIANKKKRLNIREAKRKIKVEKQKSKVKVDKKVIVKEIITKNEEGVKNAKKKV